MLIAGLQGEPAFYYYEPKRNPMSLPTITRRFEIDYGHRLMNHKGKCKNYHGHRGVFDVTVSAGTIDVKSGMIADFGDVKQMIGNWLDEFWDHGMILQEGDPFLAAATLTAFERPKLFIMDSPPTVENLVREFVKHVGPLVKYIRSDLEIAHVRLYETPNCWADFTPVR